MKPKKLITQFWKVLSLLNPHGSDETFFGF